MMWYYDNGLKNTYMVSVPEYKNYILGQIIVMPVADIDGWLIYEMFYYDLYTLAGKVVLIPAWY